MCMPDLHLCILNYTVSYVHVGISYTHMYMYTYIACIHAFKHTDMFVLSHTCCTEMRSCTVLPVLYSVRVHSCVLLFAVAAAVVDSRCPQ